VTLSLNEYAWDWEGVTNKGECIWFVEGFNVTGTPWSQAIENDIIEKTKATYYATVVAEFVKICQQQGIDAQLLDVNVYCDIVKDPLTWTSTEPPVQEYLDPWQIIPVPMIKFSQKFIVKVHGVVTFLSSKDLAGSPIAPALLVALGKVIAMVIVAILVGWGIYAFLKNLTLNETRSEITYKKKTILPDGTIVYEDGSETVTTTAPSLGAIGIIALVVILGIGLIKRR
jgi:hypothetical protein